MRISRRSPSSPLPIVVYNVPSRTVADISVETLAQPVAAAQRRRGQGCDRQSRAGERRSGSRAARTSSSSAATTTWRSASMQWVARAASRSPPTSHRGCAADFQEAMRDGRWDEALKLQDRLYPLHAALFTDASPAPTKYALSRVRNGFPGRAAPADGRSRRMRPSARSMRRWSMRA